METKKMKKTHLVRVDRLLEQQNIKFKFERVGDIVQYEIWVNRHKPIQGYTEIVGKSDDWYVKMLGHEVVEKILLAVKYNELAIEPPRDIRKLRQALKTSRPEKGVKNA